MKTFRQFNEEASKSLADLEREYASSSAGRAATRQARVKEAEREQRAQEQRARTQRIGRNIRTAAKQATRFVKSGARKIGNLIGRG